MEIEQEIKEIEVLLKTTLGENVQVIDYTTKHLTEPGENYGSLMLAVNVILNGGKKLKLVAKLPPVSPVWQKLFNSPLTFSKEIGLYKNIVPTLQQFQIEHGMKAMDFFAKFYGGRTCLDLNSDSFDENAIILLENVKELGYAIGNRFIGFDYDTTKLILNDLAVFHATPIALKLKHPRVFEEKIKPYLTKHVYHENAFQELALKQIIDITNMNEELRKYVPRIKKVLDRNVNGMNGSLYKSEPFATMCHSDYWVNNTLIKFDSNGKAIHNVMVDFQIMEYASPGNDIVFFLHSSVQKEVLNERYDELLRVYYTKFIDTLEKFHCNLTPFSYDNFMNELKMSANQLQFFHTFLMYKPIYLKKEGAVGEPSLESLMSLDHVGNDYYDRCYALIRHFVNRNWI